MGLVSSKSGLDRRNAAINRSQRKVITESQSKIVKIRADIKRFQGVEEDRKYLDIKNRIALLKRELSKSGANVAKGELKNRYRSTTNTLNELENSLVGKLKSNQEENETKTKALEEKRRKAEEEKQRRAEEEAEKKKATAKEEKIEKSDEEVEEETPESERNEVVERRKSGISAKFVQFAEEPRVRSISTEDEIIKEIKKPSSPDVKKMGGIAVMPGFSNNVSTITRRISQSFSDQGKNLTDSEIEPLLMKHIDRLHALEDEIHEFNGQRNGPRYNKFKQELNDLLVSLTHYEPQDEHLKEKIRLCKSFVGSNLSFLDERATSDSQMYVSKTTLV